MDLAKIRKKARLGQSTLPEPGAEQPSSRGVPQHLQRNRDGELSECAEHPTDFCREALVPAGAPQPDSCKPLRTDRGLSPLEIILTGRAAAGCSDGPHPSPEQQVREDDEIGYEEFLSVRVTNETYGINIMQIKEIIKPRQVTEVPHAPSYVCGVISLRGVIIPVLDMPERLGLKRGAPSGKERVVVVKSCAGLSGLLVDQVIQFDRIAIDALEPAPAVLEGIDRNFISGIGRSGRRMIILLNLDRIAEIQLQ